jgi:hypothetical protein
MRAPAIEITMLGGNCPVQAEGTVDGFPFYFRARGEHWSMNIGDVDPVCDPIWSHVEPYGTEKFDAGWMNEDEARSFIDRAAAMFVASRSMTS